MNPVLPSSSAYILYTFTGKRLTPRKRELLYYTMFYHDDGDDDGEKGDDEKDVSQRMGIEGASEIIKESRVPKSVRKDAQVVGEASGGVGDDCEGVGEGRAVGKQVHVATKERFGARKAASLSEVESVVVGGMKVREWGMAVYESW